MKSLISAVVSSVFFITNLGYAFDTHVNGIHPSQIFDSRLSLANQIEEKGMELQKIEDLYGPDVALQELKKTCEQNRKSVRLTLDKNISLLSEKNIQELLTTMKEEISSTEEEVAELLSDMSKSEREILSNVMTFTLEQNLDKFQDQLTQSIAQYGFKKTFSNLANDLRSRNYQDPEWWEVTKGAIFSVLLLAGVIGFYGSIMDASLPLLGGSLALLWFLYITSNARWWG